GLVADPVNAKLTGSCAATIGDVNGLMAMVGGKAGGSRTMSVVETLSVSESGSLGVRKKRKDAVALTVIETNDPQGELGLTVPVHCQFRLPAGKVAAVNGMPGPNCTLTRLLVRDQFAGTFSRRRETSSAVLYIGVPSTMLITDWN
ncbi:MAG: hypothetical protein WBX20_07760, partial [Terrimicrobiaceae bacterium]